MELVYHEIAKTGGIEPPFLAAIPPRPIDAHPQPKGCGNRVN
jgi:hypothetical protein